MDAELNALEEKINRLLEFCQRVRRENQQLRQELASALNEKGQLTEKITEARARLENMIARIPEN
jgi:cell division protein ZapB